MALGKGLKGFRVLAVGLLVAAPSVAYAHALLVSPVPRDTTDTKLKMGPCGDPLLTKKAPVAQYEAGATIPIQFKETIGHEGCYQLRFSSTGTDTNFTLIKQINDPAASQGTQNTTMTLPPGVTCANCTLQLLQLMNNGPCSANQDPATAAAGTYYSCADIRVGDFPDAGAVVDAGTPVEEDAGGTSSSGGSTTTPTDGGGNTSSSSSGNGSTGSRTLRQSDDDGCSVGWGATSGFSLFVSAGIAAMAIARRRRKS